MNTKEDYIAAHTDGCRDAIGEMRRTIINQMKTPGTGFTLGSLSDDQLFIVLRFVNSFAR